MSHGRHFVLCFGMDDERDDYEYLGRYAVHEAKRLLKALEEAEIGFDADFDDGSGMTIFGSFGTAAGVEVAVEKARRSDVDRLHTQLFGSSLPDQTWADEESASELNLLVAREEIAKELAEIDTDLQAILKEMTERKAVLDAGKAPPTRALAMENAQETQRGEATALLDRQRALKAALAKLEEPSA